jgi:hypothetical protein
MTPKNLRDHTDPADVVIHTQRNLLESHGTEASEEY